MDERVGKLFIYGRRPDARLKMSPKAVSNMGKSKRTFGKNGGVRMEPHRQACGTSCYAQTGDILSKEHSPTAKAVVLCVEG